MSDEFINEELEKKFPQLKTQGYRKTSEADITYNCVAHAMHEDNRWWEPPIWGKLEAGHYWPDDVSIEHNSNSYIQIFEKRGYVCCSSAELESSYEKVAVYWGVQGPHVARQLPDGEWTSKLGNYEDISHATLEGLEADGNLDAYGKVKQILKRPLT